MFFKLKLNFKNWNQNKKKLYDWQNWIVAITVFLEDI